MPTPFFLVVDADPTLALLSGQRVPPATREQTRVLRALVLGLNGLYWLSFLAALCAPAIWTLATGRALWKWPVVIVCAASVLVWCGTGLDVRARDNYGVRSYPVHTSAVGAALAILLGLLGASAWMILWAASVAVLGASHWTRRQLAGEAIRRLAIRDEAAREELMREQVIRVGFLP